MPGPGRPLTEYVDLAVAGIRGLVEQEHAVVWLEVEAKLADVVRPPLPHYIEPHHLSTARRLLVDEIEEETGVTRGGRPITVLIPRDRRRRTRIVGTTAARKRLLQARYLALASGSASRPGVIGPAGERIFHESLREAAPIVGYRILNPQGGEVREFLGNPVEGGPLDNAAIWVPADAAGIPTNDDAVILPVEVKNVREWLYPNSMEVHQLLYKAASLQNQNPGLSFTPLLVCRRAHYTLFVMARQLGFFVLDAHAQFVPPSSEDETQRVEEIRRELGYDLRWHAGPYRPFVGRLTRAIPDYAKTAPTRWKVTAPALVDWFAALRHDSQQPERGQTMTELRSAAEVAHKRPAQW